MGYKMPMNASGVRGDIRLNAPPSIGDIPIMQHETRSEYLREHRAKAHTSSLRNMDA